MGQDPGDHGGVGEDREDPHRAPAAGAGGWDDVYRDISAHLRVTSAVQQHVRDHVRWEVERVVEVGLKGRVYVLKAMRRR